MKSTYVRKTELEQQHIPHVVIKVLIGGGVETHGFTVRWLT